MKDREPWRPQAPIRMKVLNSNAITEAWLHNRPFTEMYEIWGERLAAPVRWNWPKPCRLVVSNRFIQMGAATLIFHEEHEPTDRR